MDTLASSASAQSPRRSSSASAKETTRALTALSRAGTFDIVDRALDGVAHRLEGG
jgi:hypothetical protein